MHAIPSSGDATSLWTQAKTHWRDSMLGMLGFPIAVFIYIANLLRILWFDLFYAIVLLVVVFLGVARVFGGVRSQASGCRHCSGRVFLHAIALSFLGPRVWAKRTYFEDGSPSN